MAHILPAAGQRSISIAGQRHVRDCTVCGTDMYPESDDWITCPNAQDVCIDCCGETH